MVLLMSSTILVNKQSLEEVLEENRKFRVELKACYERISFLEDEVKALKRKILAKNQSVCQRNRIMIKLLALI